MRTESWVSNSAPTSLSRELLVILHWLWLHESIHSRKHAATQSTNVFYISALNAVKQAPYWQSVDDIDGDAILSDEKKAAEDQLGMKGVETGVDNEQAAEEAPVSAVVEPESQVGDTVEIADEAQLAEQLQEQLERAREDVLRAAADAQNARRRAEQDVEKARKFALERFVQDLLPVVDNLERAMSSVDVDDETFKPVLEGIQLTYKTFQDSLSRHQVIVVDPAGEPFDPEQHQAMSMIPNGEVEPNTVLEVFQKGYLLNGRLVRPAMVVVSKSPD